MSVYVDAGCDSDQHLLSVGAHRREPYRFAGGVEDDPADTRVDRRPQFGNRFGIAVQDDSMGVHARGKRDGEFTGALPGRLVRGARSVADLLGEPRS